MNYNIKGEEDIELCTEKLTKLYGKPQTEINGEIFEGQIIKDWKTRNGYISISNMPGNTMLFITYMSEAPDF